MSDRAKLRMKLDVPHLAGTEMLVEAFAGREAISEPFAFEVRFVTDRDSEIDPLEAVGKPATLVVEVGDHELKVAGVIAEFRIEDPTPSRDLAYAVTIGPRLGLIGLSRQNQVYGTQTDTSLPDLVDAMLTNKYGSTSNTGGHGQTIPSSMRLQAAYPARRHVVQYEESDLAFLSRVCEHDGVFYFFEHGDGGDTVVFGDSNLAFTEAKVGKDGGDDGDKHGRRKGKDDDGEGIPFRRDRQLHRPGEAAIVSFRGGAKPVAGKIYLRDYNETTPSMELLASAAVKGDGPGVVVEYGANFDILDRGSTLATIRAQELACRRLVFTGEATVPQLRPGTFFKLSKHPNMSLERQYLVVAAEHSAETPVAAAFTAGGGVRSYRNVITCIPFETDTPFRPERRTPVPRPGGLFTAKIDAAGDGSRAEIDASGRYKVRLAYDETNAPSGKASTALRRAQPYAGPGDSGLHFPLLKSTEVVVSYLNGDPDRPVILGALANPLTPDVVTSGNNVFNRIRSASGTLFEINDGIAAATSEAVASAGVPATAHAEAPGSRGGEAGAAPAPAAAAALPATPHADAASEAVTTASQIFTRFDVPSAPGGDPRTGNYIRLGSYIPAEEAGIVPGVKYSTSETSVESQDPEQAAAASGKQTQNKNTSVTVKATPHDSSYNGILVYTNQDRNETITGASLSKFGKGHATETTTGDSTHAVKAGQYTLSAYNGIAITAGTVAADGKTPDHAADLKLTASNYIKQTAYGPLSEATYGDSRKITYGNAYDEFHGTKTSYFYGDETTVKFATSKQIYVNALFVDKISAELTLALSINTKITVGGDIKIAAPFDIKIIAGTNTTIVVGIDMKMVSGTTLKITTLDNKLVMTHDTKLVGGFDTKSVNADVKFCNFKHESSLLWADKKPLGLEDNDIEASKKSIEALQGNLSSKIGNIFSWL